MDENKVLEKVYHEYKFVGDEVWKEEIHPKIEQLNKKYKSFFSENDFQENKEVNNILKEAEHNYKKSFNHFGYWMLAIFGLFLSFILIVPFYFALKKFKEMKSVKNNLLNILEEAKINKLDFLGNKMSKLNLEKYFDEVIKITKFKNCGPVHESIVNYVKQNSIFKLSNNENKNTSSTSWGIFDGNKIVVNLQYAKYKMVNEVYTGSRVVRRGDDSYTVVASIVMPKPIFEYNSSHWFFMRSCENLELNLAKSYNKIKRNLTFSKDVLLENKEFEKSFKWEYNDPIQFRMIFTPFTQEYFVNNAFRNKTFDECFRLTKSKSFISNQVKCSSMPLTNSLLKLSKDLNTNLIDIDNIIKIIAIDKIKSSYSRITPGWILPILKSEDHTDALNQINSSDVIPNYSTFHYILNKIIRKRIAKADTDTFNEITSSFKFKSNSNHDIYGVEMKGLSFWAVDRVETVWKQGVAVSVPYVEYVPEIKYKYIFMTYIKNKWRHLYFWELINRWRNNDLDNELSPIIEKYEAEDILICLDKSILTIMSDKLPKEDIVNIFDEIIEIINRHN